MTRPEPAAPVRLRYRLWTSGAAAGPGQDQSMECGRAFTRRLRRAVRSAPLFRPLSRPPSDGNRRQCSGLLLRFAPLRPRAFFRHHQATGGGRTQASRDRLQSAIRLPISSSHLPRRDLPVAVLAWLGMDERRASPGTRSRAPLARAGTRGLSPGKPSLSGRRDRPRLHRRAGQGVLSARGFPRAAGVTATHLPELEAARRHEGGPFRGSRRACR